MALRGNKMKKSSNLSKVLSFGAQQPSVLAHSLPLAGSGGKATVSL